MKRTITITAIISLCLFLNACSQSGVSHESYDELQASFNSLQEKYDAIEADYAEIQVEKDALEEELKASKDTVSGLEKDLADAKAEITELSEKIDDLVNGPEALLVAIRNAYEAKDWAQVVSLAADLHAKANGSSEDTEAQSLSAKAAKEIEREEAAKAAEEAKSYKTGITYNQLTRNPNDYKGKKATFRGKVFQSFENGNTTNIMMVVDGNYNYIMYITIDSSKLPSRVIENDWITVRGISNGIYTYESSGNGMLSVPWVKADYIDR